MTEEALITELRQRQRWDDMGDADLAAAWERLTTWDVMALPPGCALEDWAEACQAVLEEAGRRWLAVMRRQLV